MEGVLLTSPDSIDYKVIKFLSGKFAENNLDFEGFIKREMKKEDEWNCPTIMDNKSADNRSIHAYHSCGMKCIQLHDDSELFGDVLGFSFRKIKSSNGSPQYFLFEMYLMKKGDTKVKIWWSADKEKGVVPRTLDMRDFVDLPEGSVLREKGFNSMHLDWSYIFTESSKYGTFALLRPDHYGNIPSFRFIYTKIQMGTYWSEFDPPHSGDSIGFDYFFDRQGRRLRQKYATQEDGRIFRGYMFEHDKIPTNGRKFKRRKSRLETALGINVPIQVKLGENNTLFRIKNIFHLPENSDMAHRHLSIGALLDPDLLLAELIRDYV